LCLSKPIPHLSYIQVHDCALTENYVVILDFPLTIRPRRLVTNSFPAEYEPGNGARIGLTSRINGVGEATPTAEETPTRTQWFDVESGVILHAANAYERKGDDGKTVAAVVVHGFKSVPNGASSFILDYTPAFLHEWVLDPVTGKTVNERCLNPDVMVEFPQVQDKLSGRKADAVYGLVATTIGGPLLFKTPEVGAVLNSVVKFALEDNDASGATAGDVIGRFDLTRGWHMVSEPTVVSKTGSDDDDDAGDNNGHYVLLIVTYTPPSATTNVDCGDDDDDDGYLEIARDGKSMTSQFLVLDGDCISDGPVTTVDLPSHVNFGLHSMFLDWEKMK